mmetsp:Transcript_45981/g.112219  ORF Transcript_45981/g.112219 Transcript_45981/m.112219 type:complete len:82 (+) Transcript_45981:973-1218(+)
MLVWLRVLISFDTLMLGTAKIKTSHKTLLHTHRNLPPVRLQNNDTTRPTPTQPKNEVLSLDDTSRSCRGQRPADFQKSKSI